MEVRHEELFDLHSPNIIRVTNEQEWDGWGMWHLW